MSRDDRWSVMTTNRILAVSTLVATIFVAIQAWYARVQFVEASETRLLEKKLDICFENFDAAVALDAELRSLVEDGEAWPPRISVMAQDIDAMRENVVPQLNRLQSSLAKAAILGPLDRFRLFLAGELDGLSREVFMMGGDAAEGAEAELEAVLDRLSNFLGAQYSVYEGCRNLTGGNT